MATLGGECNGDVTEEHKLWGSWTLDRNIFGMIGDPTIKTSIYFVENGVMQQFRPYNYFKVVQRPQFTPWNSTTVTGPSKAEDVPRVLEELRRTNYPPFLIVNIYAQFNIVGQIQDNFTRNLLNVTDVFTWKERKYGNCMLYSHNYSCRQLLFDIQTVYSGEFEYIRVGDFTGTSPWGNDRSNSYFYHRDFFLFAHKSIVRGFKSIPYSIYSSNVEGVQADVSTGPDDSPYMYKALGSMYVDPRTGYRDETCPAVLKIFLKYSSGGAGSAIYKHIPEERMWTSGSGPQHPFVNEPTIAEMRLGFDKVVNNEGYVPELVGWRKDPTTGTYVPIRNYDYNDLTSMTRVFIQNARVHNFSGSFNMCDLIFTVKDALDHFGDAITKSEYSAFVGNAFLQSIIDDNFVKLPYVHRIMIAICNSTLPDIRGLKYPDLCACVGRLGVEDALREEMGVPYVRLICQSQRCLDGGIAQDVYSFTPTPPCVPINVCNPNLKIDANNAYISNVILNCDVDPPVNDEEEEEDGGGGSTGGGSTTGGASTGGGSTGGVDDSPELVIPSSLTSAESRNSIIIGVSVTVTILCFIIVGIVVYIVRKKKKDALLAKLENKK